MASIVAIAGKSPAPHNDRHSEGTGAHCHLLTDMAVPQQAERSAEQATGLRILLLVPSARAKVDDVIGKPTIEGQDQPEGEFGDRDRVLARTVRDVDSTPGGRSDVD